MPSLADLPRARRRRERRRLATGVGLLLVGALLVGLGAAGVVRGGSVRTGVAAGGLAVWAGLLGLALRAPLAERERILTAAGAAVGLAGVLGFWAVAPADVVSGPLLAPFATALGYLLGLAVVLAAVLAAVSGRPTARGAASGPAASSPATAWRRSTGGGPSGHAADGGSRDDDLSFPLEDD
jgi:peptidoglycan/LPS O-acetylase OafA/YrhL